MFAGLSSLKSVVVPSTVTSIGVGAFCQCSSLTNVVFLGDAPDVGNSIYEGTPRRLTTHVSNDSIGWSGGISDALPTEWQERAIKYVGEGGYLPTKYETVFITNVVEQVLDVENFITVYATNVVEQFVTVEVTNYVEAVGADSSVVSDEVQSYEPQAGFDGTEKETYNGIAYDADGKLCGLVQITTAKADKKGAVKVGGFLMLQDGKKQTLKSATGKIDEGYVSVVSSVGKLGPVIVVIGADGFRGAIGDMSIVSADTSEGAGIVKGSLTVSYFDAKTNKLKTKTAKVAGVTAEGMASGTIEVKKEGVREFAAEVQ